jgi:hypothetical protein
MMREKASMTKSGREGLVPEQQLLCRVGAVNRNCGAPNARTALALAAPKDLNRRLQRTGHD